MQAIWDRASLVAINQEDRAKYAHIYRIFSVACVKNSVHTGRGEGEVPGQVHPPGRYTSPWAGTPWAGTPPGQVHLPLGRYTPHGQRAGSSHPTGMHSCFPVNLECIKRRWLYFFYVTEKFLVNLVIKIPLGCKSDLLTYYFCQ